MDEDLKTYLEGLEGMERRSDAKFANMRVEMQRLEDRGASLLAAEVGNLHTEMRTGFERVNEHLHRIDERLDRQGFMLAGGTKALGGLLEHYTNVNTNYERVLIDIGELRARIEKLEKETP